MFLNTGIIRALTNPTPQSLHLKLLNLGPDRTVYRFMDDAGALGSWSVRGEGFAFNRGRDGDEGSEGLIRV